MPRTNKTRSKKLTSTPSWVGGEEGGVASDPLWFYFYSLTSLCRLQKLAMLHQNTMSNLKNILLLITSKAGTDWVTLVF